MSVQTRWTSNAAQRWAKLPPSLQMITNEEDVSVYGSGSSSSSSSSEAATRSSTSSRSLKRRGDSDGEEVVPSFPCALYNIVNDKRYNAWIRWSDDGATFEFCNWRRLMTALNDSGLRGTKRQSVVKNLRDYGFVALQDARKHMVAPDGKRWLKYQHEFFQQGDYSLLRDMRRKRLRTA